MSPHLPDETLQLLADGALSGDSRASAEAHLGECPDCAALADEYRELFGDLGALPQPLPPPRFTQAVMAKVAARERDLAAERRWALGTFGLAVAAALLCFLGAGNHAWAHQVTAWSGALLELGRLTRVGFEVVEPLLSTLRLPVLMLCGLLVLPMLMVLYRSLPARAAAAP